MVIGALRATLIATGTGSACATTGTLSGLCLFAGGSWRSEVGGGARFDADAGARPVDAGGGACGTLSAVGLVGVCCKESQRDLILWSTSAMSCSFL